MFTDEKSNPNEQAELKNKSKEESSGWDKATVISVISLVISILSIIVSVIFSFKLSDYEREQSRIPDLTFLNQSVRVPFSIEPESTLYDYDGILNFSKIDSSNYPIRIPVRNIGVGLAQNVYIEFSIESQISVLEQCRDRFEQYGFHPDSYTYYVGTRTYRSLNYLRQYNYTYKDDNLYSIEYVGCPNHTLFKYSTASAYTIHHGSRCCCCLPAYHRHARAGGTAP